MYKRWGYSDIVKANEAAFEAASFITQEVRKEKEKEDMTHKEAYELFLARCNILRDGARHDLKKTRIHEKRMALQACEDVSSRAASMLKFYAKKDNYRTALNTVWQWLKIYGTNSLNTVECPPQFENLAYYESQVQTAYKLYKYLERLSQQLER